MRFVNRAIQVSPEYSCPPRMASNADTLDLSLGANKGDGSERRGRSSVLGAAIGYTTTMPRRPRVCPAHTCFHVLNRAVARLPLFEKSEDYDAFERVLQKLGSGNRFLGTLIASCPIIGILWFAQKQRTNRQISSAGLRTLIRCVGTLITTRKEQGICTKVDLRLFRSKTTRIFWRCCVTLNAIRFEQAYANAPKIGNLEVLGVNNIGIQSNRGYSRNGQFLDLGLGLPTSMRLTPKVSSKQFAGVSFAEHPTVRSLG